MSYLFCISFAEIVVVFAVLMSGLNKGALGCREFEVYKTPTEEQNPFLNMYNPGKLKQKNKDGKFSFLGLIAGSTV